MADSFSLETTQDEFRGTDNATMDFHLWRRLFGYVLKYKSTLIWIAVCGAVTGGCEIFSGLLTKWMIDDVQINGQEARIVFWAILFLISSVLLCVVIGGFVFLVCRIRAQATHDIRQEAFTNIQRQSFSFFDKRATGWLMARLMADCEKLTNIVTWAFLDFVWGTTMMLSMGIVMLVLNWKLALCAYALIPILAYITIKFRRSILTTAREVRATNSVITGSINESIMGVLTSKSFVQEASNLRDFSQLTDKLYSASVRNLTLSAIYVPIVMTAGSLCTGIALAVGGVELLNAIIIPGTLLLFLTWMGYFLEPTLEMAGWFTEMQTAQASAERIFAVMDAKPEIVSTTKSNHPLPQKIETLTVSKVSFEYIPGTKALEEVALSVRSGESIAFVGPTGGGKTTLANLLCRFYEPTTGSVQVNGTDYRQFPLHGYRSKLGVVLQHPHVFSGSIFENIRYGSTGAKRDDVERVARLAGAHDFIESMDQGYDTEAGAGGSRLSAGQKQLISIARAILADPQILIFDEATSSVDTETEQHIQAGIESLLRDRICFIIAHRLSTIRNATRIAYIHKGKIVEYGTHNELLYLQGLYAKSYQQQSLSVAVESSFKLAEVESTANLGNSFS